MNIEELMEIAKVFFQWGMMLITFGIASISVAGVLMLISYYILETQSR